MAMGEIEFAKSVCEAMLDMGYSITTENLLKPRGVWENSQRGKYRDVLQRLADIGVLHRYGVGKFRWRLINRDFDRSNPLNTKPTDGHEPDKGKGPTTIAKHVRPCACCERSINIGDKIHKVTLESGREAWVHLACEPKKGGSTTTPTDARSSDLIEKMLKGMLEVIDDLKSELATVKAKHDELDRMRRTEIVIKRPDLPDKKITEHVHPVFEQALFHLSVGDNVMLVGPKGCGKSHLCSQLAKALDVEFGFLSLSGGVTESRLFGRVVPNVQTGKNEYHGTVFVDLWEKGGLYLLDEVDSGDPNVLLSMNSALANGFLALDRTKNPIAKMHKKFHCMAAANTWGNGADRQYVGRNQQDSAFTERFVQLAMDYDRDLEFQLCEGNADMVRRYHGYRDRIVANRLERTMSTRFLLRAHKWIQHGKDIDYCDEMFFAGWRKDEINKVKSYS